MELTHRVATTDDLGMLEAVMDAAIGELQQGFLSPAEIESSRAIMGIDTQLIKCGVGRLILSLCQEAARKEGFTRLELMGTMSGEPLYAAYGFAPIERLADDRGGASVPLVRMAKTIDEEPQPR